MSLDTKENKSFFDDYDKMFNAFIDTLDKDDNISNLANNTSSFTSIFNNASYGSLNLSGCSSLNNISGSVLTTTSSNTSIGITGTGLWSNGGYYGNTITYPNGIGTGNGLIWNQPSMSYGYTVSPTNILQKYSFNFKNKKYNEILNNKVSNMGDNFITFNVENTSDYRIEPLDTINILLNELTTLIITKTRDGKELCNITIKGFKFTKITNILTFTNYITVEFTSENIVYDNPNIPIQEKRNSKISKLLE
jgi:hypothetical protein